MGNMDIPRATYREVLAEPSCHLCGGTTLQLEGEGWAVDHLVPRAMGGDHSRANLRKAHSTCNKWRGSRPLSMGLYDRIHKRRQVELYVQE